MGAEDGVRRNGKRRAEEGVAAREEGKKEKQEKGREGRGKRKEGKEKRREGNGVEGKRRKKNGKEQEELEKAVFEERKKNKEGSMSGPGQRSNLSSYGTWTTTGVAVVEVEKLMEMVIYWQRRAPHSAFAPLYSPISFPFFLFLIRRRASNAMPPLPSPTTSITTIPCFFHNG